jgi:hypothetical protein
MQRAATGGAIALAEDGLDQATVDLVQQLSGAAQTIGIKHSKQLDPWDCTIYRGTPLSAYRAQLLRYLNGQVGGWANPNAMFVTTSQAEARRLEKAAIADGIDVERIDSTTNEGGRYRAFFENPSAWLDERQPTLLIVAARKRDHPCSQTVGSAHINCKYVKSPC